MPTIHAKRVHADLTGDYPNPLGFNARGDFRQSFDGSMTVGRGGNVLTCASAPFKPDVTNASGVLLSEVGKLVWVDRAGTGTWIAATIIAYVSPTNVRISVQCSTTVNAAWVIWATDDTVACQAFLNSNPPGRVFDFIGRNYLVTTLYVGGNTILLNANLWTKPGSTDFVSPVTIDARATHAAGPAPFAPDTSAKANIQLQSVHVDGLRHFQTGTSLVGATTENGGRHAFRVLGRVSDLLMSDCWGQNSAGDGLYLTSAAESNDDTDLPLKRITLRNCRFDYNRRNGCSPQGIQDWLVEGSTTFSHNGTILNGATNTASGDYGAQIPAGSYFGYGSAENPSGCFGTGIDYENDQPGPGSRLYGMTLIKVRCEQNYIRSMAFFPHNIRSTAGTLPNTNLRFIDCYFDSGTYNEITGRKVSVEMDVNQIIGVGHTVLVTYQDVVFTNCFLDGICIIFGGYNVTFYGGTIIPSIGKPVILSVTNQVHVFGTDLGGTKIEQGYSFDSVAEQVIGYAVYADNSGIIRTGKIDSGVGNPNRLTSKLVFVNQTPGGGPLGTYGNEMAAITVDPDGTSNFALSLSSNGHEGLRVMDDGSLHLPVRFLGTWDNTAAALQIGKADPLTGANRLTSKLQFINSTPGPGQYGEIASIVVDPDGTSNYSLALIANGHEGLRVNSDGSVRLGNLSLPMQLLGPQDNTIAELRIGKVSPVTGANLLTSKIAFRNAAGSGTEMAALTADPDGLGNYSVALSANGIEGLRVLSDGSVSVGAMKLPLQLKGPADNSVATLKIGKSDPGSGANRLTSALQFMNGPSSVIGEIVADPLGVTAYDLIIRSNGKDRLKFTSNDLINVQFPLIFDAANLVGVFSGTADPNTGVSMNGTAYQYIGIGSVYLRGSTGVATPTIYTKTTAAQFTGWMPVSGSDITSPDGGTEIKMDATNGFGSINVSDHGGQTDSQFQLNLNGNTVIKIDHHDDGSGTAGLYRADISILRLPNLASGNKAVLRISSNAGVVGSGSLSLTDHDYIDPGTMGDGDVAQAHLGAIRGRSPANLVTDIESAMSTALRADTSFISGMESAMSTALQADTAFMSAIVSAVLAATGFNTGVDNRITAGMSGIISAVLADASYQSDVNSRVTSATSTLASHGSYGGSGTANLTTGAVTVSTSI